MSDLRHKVDYPGDQPSLERVLRSPKRRTETPPAAWCRWCLAYENHAVSRRHLKHDQNNPEQYANLREIAAAKRKNAHIRPHEMPKQHQQEIQSHSEAKEQHRR